MKTLSLKVPELLLKKLDAAAKKRGESRSAILREAVEAVLEGGGQARQRSCLDFARDLAGSAAGPTDLSYGKRWMEGYGT